MEREPDLEIVGEAASGAEALQMAQYRLPDAVVLDLQVSSPSGMETVRAIWDACSGVNTVVVSLSAGEEYIQEVMRAGALGFVSSDSAGSDLARAVRYACQHKPFVSPCVL